MTAGAQGQGTLLPPTTTVGLPSMSLPIPPQCFVMSVCRWAPLPLMKTVSEPK